MSHLGLASISKSNLRGDPAQDAAIVKMVDGDSSSSGAANVLLTNVVPAFGALISLLMYASPVMAVLSAAKLRGLGDLNPIPFVVTVANTFSWAAFGLIKQDPYVTTPNAPGVVIALFCVLTCYGIADEKLQARMRLFLCLEVSVLSLLGVLTSFAASTPKEQLSIWGLSGNLWCLIYYAAPLSTMAEVVRTRNSASILLPMTVMNCANAALWTTYGVAISDVYIWLPNGIGLVLSVIQVLLAFIFPARPKTSQGGGASLGGSSALHEANYSRLTHADEEIRLAAGMPKS